MNIAHKFRSYNRSDGAEIRGYSNSEAINDCIVDSFEQYQWAFYGVLVTVFYYRSRDNLTVNY